jgi:hypothetical protein
VKHLTEHEAWRRYVRIRFMDFGCGIAVGVVGTLAVQ